MTSEATKIKLSAIRKLLKESIVNEHALRHHNQLKNITEQVKQSYYNQSSGTN